METYVAIITATGMLAIIGIILKWLVSAMGKHVDRMGKHVDNLEQAFNNQSERLIAGVDGVRDSLDSHIQEEDEVYSSITSRLDTGDQFNNLLLERVTQIESKLDDYHASNGNGVH